MALKQRVEAALFQQLIANSSLPLIGSALGGLLVATALMEAGDQRLVLAWFALVQGTVAVRYWLTRCCKRRLATEGYNQHEAVRYAVSTSLSGMAWGAAGFLIPGSGPIAMVITITAVQAMVMGAVLTLGAFIPSFLAFALPAILPLILFLAISGGTANMILALYSLIFLLLMVGIALRFNRSLRHTWELSYEKEDLVQALTIAHDHLSILAETDGLTGIANRRRFDEVLEAEFSRLRRSGAPLSLILLDVDHFKAYNDTYGHIEGDRCLKQVAAVFQQYLNRSPDFAARYGGEEFAGILPETGHIGATALAENIRAGIAALAIPHQSAPTADHLTASLGVVTVDCKHIQSPAEAVALADRQLYLAKSEGRNQVAAWQANP